MSAPQQSVYTGAIVDDDRLIDHNIQIHGLKSEMTDNSIMIVCNLAQNKVNLCFNCDHFDDRQ